jgi:hypothetical protein
MITFNWLSGPVGTSDAKTLALELARHLAPQVTAPARGRGRWKVSLLPGAPLVADSAAKVVIRDGGGKPAAILLCSSSLAPDQVSRALAMAARARQLLGSGAGKAILDPLVRGQVEGLSYAVFPWCWPLSSHRLGWPLQRRRLRPRLLDWLRQKLRVTMCDPAPAEVEASFLAPLGHIARSTDLAAEVRAAAEFAARRLHDGLWRPRLILVHNDLWKGNILLRRPESFLGWRRKPPFVVIDWAGAREKGPPFYDLVRLADSLRLARGALARQVRWYCAALGCERVDAKGYLLAGLGELGMFPGHFPRARYVGLVHRCCQGLFPALGRAGLPARTVAASL